MLKTIGFWFDNARYTALAQSFFPALLSIAMAYNNPNFSFSLSIIALIGVVFAHLGLNMADDYFDYKNGDVNRREKAVEGMRIRIAKCDYLINKQATTKQLLIAIIIFLSLALISALIIIYHRGYSILWLILTTAILGLGYSFPKIRLSYRGFGELVIGIIFGPLLMVGMFFASCGEYSLPLFLVSLAIGLLVINIVYSHSVMDMPCDTSIGKKTLAHLLKSNKNRLIATRAFSFIPFFIIILGIILGYFSWKYIFVLISLPIAIKLYLSLRDFALDIPFNEKPKWYLLTMERWEEIQKAGISWFMFRWYLSRNLVTLFCLILIIINIIP
ncbi:MAG: prenyltransferase [Bacteroidales bacterium]|jgi:1,4-dihydroxy-2-naphthoate octaprenyltransferase|nr:prenyltransferase [Bacteroidales bacterium]